MGLLNAVRTLFGRPFQPAHPAPATPAPTLADFDGRHQRPRTVDDSPGEQAKSGPPGVKMPAFLPYFDDPTGAGIPPIVLRRMVASPYVKAALYGKVVGVCALDLKVHPATKKNPRDKETAEFLKWNLTERLSGGVPELVWNVLIHGCIDGLSICEKVKTYQDQGRFKGKSVLARVKPKTVGDDLVPIVDEFRNITALQGLRYNAGVELNTNDFLIYRHQPLYDNPTGNSDLRACYATYWRLDAASKLRLLGLNRAALGILVGTYKAPSQKASMETMLTGLSSGNWASVPDGVQVEVLNLAASSVDVFNAAEQSYVHALFLALQGAYLQSLEGSVSDAAGNSQVHRSTADLWVWFLSATVQTLLNDYDTGLVRWLIDLNYFVDEYPRVSLGAVDVNEQTLRLAIYQGAHLLGQDLSREQVGEELGLEPPLDDGDKLPGAPPQGGGPGGPPGGGGGPGGPGGSSPFMEQTIQTAPPQPALLQLNEMKPAPAVAAPTFFRYSDAGEWNQYLRNGR